MIFELEYALSLISFEYEQIDFHRQRLRLGARLEN